MLNTIANLFHFDNLSLVMMGLIAFVTLCIGTFSSRYLHGDRKQSAFYINLMITALSVCVMVSADHLLLMLGAWVLSNLFLARLMLHKSEWEAARQSAILALKTLSVGFMCLSGAFLALYVQTGTASIQQIISASIGPIWGGTVGTLLLITAMTQSALWPFHKWLISSLNSPSPVSAFMHAGLVNGGGFLLARFAPIIFENGMILNMMFILGIITVLLGTFWKLIQSDIKRMLACSTMAQMGFMIVQCGLGLFPAAVAHLCWHGLFKAYLFLGSGTAAQIKNFDFNYPPSIREFMMALMCGLSGAYIFSLTSGKNILPLDTSFFLVVMALIAGTQCALTLIRGKFSLKLPLILGLTSLIGAFYGTSVAIFEIILVPLEISSPQPLNIWHISALLLLTVSWLVMLFGRISQKVAVPEWMLEIYVKMLNSSQPHPKTVTAHRNHYQF